MKAEPTFRERLEERHPLLGTIVTLPSPDVAELLARAGFDWLFIDMEHGLLDVADVQRIVQAAGHVATCIVRVPSCEPMWITKALDTGAAGVIVPHVNGAADACAAVRAAKYPPRGERSIGVTRAHGFGRNIGEAIAVANDRTLVVVQAEHREAAARIEEIVQVPGVDAVFIGPYDLSGSFGKPGEIDAPEVRTAMDGILAACGRRSLACGTLVADARGARDAFAIGYSLVSVGTDTLLLARTAAGIVDACRAHDSRLLTLDS